MNRLLILALLALPCWGAYGNGYTYRRTVTIDHTKVPNTDQANFPVLFSGTYAYLAHTTHSGLVTDLNGYDIILTSDAVGSTKLDHEIESYNHETGVCVFWVRVPTVATASDTVIYLFYGNSSVSTSQEAVTGAWNSNYVGVWHVPDGTTLTTLDSTGNNSDFTNNGTVTAAAGEIDGGTGTFAAYKRLYYAGGAQFNSSDWTAEAWVYRTGTPPTNYGGTILGHQQTGATAGHWVFCINPTNYLKIEIPWVKGDVIVSTATVPQDAWTHVVGTKSGTTYSLYINGASAATPVTDASSPTISGYVYAGGQQFNETNWFFPGTLDELRVSDSARSAGWVTTSYNNHSSPSTFYAVGSQEEFSAAARRRVVIVQ